MWEQWRSKFHTLKRISNPSSEFKLGLPSIAIISSANNSKLEAKQILLVLWNFFPVFSGKRNHCAYRVR
jgi:hypothetical protein